ncbi:hypothetical protein DFQ27_000818 [Actinomortierella ambigua]|uniref:Uncharacterized protein n=1 Tax=Actinomortierella ambigua TaxID=1343610 RepID=A0A9P6U990_9FUNG|nr:hypothetical protein DFQ27_000818 [Actinomortierella ambigua]
MFSSYSRRLRSNRSSAVADQSSPSTPTRPLPAHSARRPRHHRQERIVHEVYIEDDDDSEGDEEGGGIIIVMRREPEVPVYYYAWLPYLRGFILLLAGSVLAIDIFILSSSKPKFNTTIRRVTLDIMTILYILYVFLGTMPIHAHWRRGLLCLLSSLWWINTLMTVSNYSGSCQQATATLCALDYLATALSFLTAIVIVVEMHSTYREYMLNKLIRKSILEGGSEYGGGVSGYELSQPRRRERISSSSTSTGGGRGHGRSSSGGPEMYAYDRRRRDMRSLSRTSSLATLPAYESVPGAPVPAAPTFYQPPAGTLSTRSQVPPPPLSTPTPPPDFEEALRSSQQQQQQQQQQQAVPGRQQGLESQTTPSSLLSSPPAYRETTTSTTTIPSGTTTTPQTLHTAGSPR